MSTPSRALLPTGFYDLLYPDAGFEALLQGQIMQAFQGFGYERVKPPLVEFEENLLLAGSNKMDKDTFRLMDPASQRMMGIRTDITMQIGRIALSRLKRAPRPLRLCYSGTTLSTNAQAINPARQFTQAGAELIGVTSRASDVEAIVVAVEGMTRIGVRDISVDLNLPTLAPQLLEDAGLPVEERRNILSALAQKDLGALDHIDAPIATLLRALTQHCGPADSALAALESLDFPADIAPLIDRLRYIAHRVRQNCPGCEITIDAAEHRGFDYHTGISFALFAKGIDGEIGRGGRYCIAFDNKTPAIGFTIYLSRLLPILQMKKPKPRVYIPAGILHLDIREAIGEEYVTVHGLEDTPLSDTDAMIREAKRLGCQYLWLDDTLTPTPK